MTTFRYEQDRRRRQVRALDGDARVGRFVWDPASGVVYHAYVKPEYQGRGIGVGMWEFAAYGDEVPDTERPRRPLEPDVRNAEGDALYWAGRKRREARERGEEVLEPLKDVD